MRSLLAALVVALSLTSCQVVNVPYGTTYRGTPPNESVLLCEPGGKVAGLDLKGSHDIIVQGCDIDGGVYMEGVENILFQDTDIGPSQGFQAVYIQGSPRSKGVEFRRVRFHDVTVSHRDQHMECMWIAGVDGLRITESRFERCTYFNIFLTEFEGNHPTGVQITGNSMACPIAGPLGPAFYSIMIAHHEGLDHIVDPNESECPNAHG